MRPCLRHPPHHYEDGTWYAITASTYGRRRWLAGDEAKTIMRDKLRALTIEFNIKL
jgi:hypothetical protein